MTRNVTRSIAAVPLWNGRCVGGDRATGGEGWVFPGTTWRGIRNITQHHRRRHTTDTPPAEVDNTNHRQRSAVRLHRSIGMQRKCKQTISMFEGISLSKNSLGCKSDYNVVDAQAQLYFLIFLCRHCRQRQPWPSMPSSYSSSGSRQDWGLGSSWHTSRPSWQRSGAEGSSWRRPSAHRPSKPVPR